MVACGVLLLIISYRVIGTIFVPDAKIVIYPLLYFFDLLPAVISLAIVTLVTFILTFYNQPDGSKKGCLYSLIIFSIIGGLFYLQLHTSTSDGTSPICGIWFLIVALCVVFLINIVRRKDNRIIKRAIGVLFATFGFSLYIGIFFLFTAKNINHLSSVYMDNKSYQLASVSHVDASCRWLSYILYTCDANGFICHQGKEVSKDFQCRARGFDPINGKLTVTHSDLYLQIGDQKTLITQ